MKPNFNKYIIFILLLVFCISMAACSKNAQVSTSGDLPAHAVPGDSQKSDGLDISNEQTVLGETEPVDTTVDVNMSQNSNASDEANTPESLDKANNRFIHVQGNKIVDANGSEYIIRGMAFGNEVWSNPSLPSDTHHNEESYAELAELGFNSVRFYLNYGLFEDDKKPYEYKETGFAWIDQNIEWAKKYGIRLILNMHYPQGGYQSQGNGMKLWTEAENQKRLISLWKEIAERYAEEDYIIGFGLINEPYAPLLGTEEESVLQVKDLMQGITNAIREVDTNHIVFIERACAFKNLDTGESNWVNIPFLIDDENAVYEYHDYSPHSFTHQDMDWAGTAGKVVFYPSDEVIIEDYVSYWVGCEPASYISSEGEWRYFESSKVSGCEEYNIGSVTFQAVEIGNGNTVYLDDVVITEYDEAGNVTGTISYSMNEQDCSDFYFWANDSKGSCGFEPNIGKTEAGCLYIKDTTSDANGTGLKFELKEGKSYTISGWINVNGVSEQKTVVPRIDFSLARSVNSLNYDYLESMFLKNVAFYTENNVPIYVGEFGCTTKSFNGRGGEQWVEDMLTILNNNGTSYNYHTYHEPSFGLYMGDGEISQCDRNDALAEIFKAAQN